MDGKIGSIVQLLVSCVLLTVSMTLGAIQVLSRPLVDVWFTSTTNETKNIGVTKDLLNKVIDLGKIKKVKVQSYHPEEYKVTFKGAAIDTSQMYEVNIIDQLTMDFKDTTVEATVTVTPTITKSNNNTDNNNFIYIVLLLSFCSFILILCLCTLMYTKATSATYSN